MKTNLLIAAFLTMTLLANTGLSQDSLFSGRGFGSGSLEMPKTIEVQKPRWPPKILDFSKGDSTQTAKTPFSALFKKPNFPKPKFDFFKPKSTIPGVVDRRPTLADLFPKRDPNRPTIFETMNQKSKSFFGKTSDWLAGKNQNMKQKSTDTWNSVIKDFNDIRNQENIAPRPNVRTADAAGQPRVRF